MLVLVLVGCGASPLPLPEPTALTTAPILSTPTTPLPSAAIQSPPPTLELWTTERGAALTLVGGFIADFQRETGVKVHLQAKTPVGLRADLVAAALSGTPLPQLFWGDQDDLAGLLADGQLQAFPAGAWEGASLPATLVGARRDGQVWGMPVTAQGTLFIVINRALTSKLPQTTDELIVASRAVHSDAHVGIVAGWAQARWLLAWLDGFGGSPTDATGLQPTLDTAEMRSALNLLLELRAATLPQQVNYLAGQQLFKHAEAAIIVEGDWALAGYQALEPKLDLEIGPLPLVPATGRSAQTPLGASYLMLQRDLAPAQVAQAQALGEYVRRNDIQVRLAETLGRLPAVQQSLVDPTLKSNPHVNAALVHALTAPGLPPTQAARCALQAIEDWLPALIEGKRTQDETAQEMQRAAEACSNKT